MQAIACNRSINMLNILLEILRYLGQFQEISYDNLYVMMQLLFLLKKGLVNYPYCIWIQTA